MIRCCPKYISALETCNLVWGKHQRPQNKGFMVIRLTIKHGLTNRKGENAVQLKNLFWTDVLSVEISESEMFHMFEIDSG